MVSVPLCLVGDFRPQGISRAVLLAFFVLLCRDLASANSASAKSAVAGVGPRRIQGEASVDTLETSAVSPPTATNATNSSIAFSSEAGANRDDNESSSIGGSSGAGVNRDDYECADAPVGWLDYDGDSCTDYVENEWCTSTGDTGPMWNESWGTIEDFENESHTALTACCKCGGGYLVKRLVLSPFLSTEETSKNMAEQDHPQNDMVLIFIVIVVLCVCTALACACYLLLRAKRKRAQDVESNSFVENDATTVHVYPEHPVTRSLSETTIPEEEVVHTSPPEFLEYQGRRIACGTKVDEFLENLRSPSLTPSAIAQNVSGATSREYVQEFAGGKPPIATPSTGASSARTHTTQTSGSGTARLYSEPDPLDSLYSVHEVSALPETWTIGLPESERNYLRG